MFISHTERGINFDDLCLQLLHLRALYGELFDLCLDGFELFKSAAQSTALR